MSAEKEISSGKTGEKKTSQLKDAKFNLRVEVKDYLNIVSLWSSFLGLGLTALIGVIGSSLNFPSSREESTRVLILTIVSICFGLLLISYLAARFYRQRLSGRKVALKKVEEKEKAFFERIRLNINLLLQERQ
jgi:hypothetical protein